MKDSTDDFFFLHENAVKDVDHLDLSILLELNTEICNKKCISMVLENMTQYYNDFHCAIELHF